MKTFLIIEAIVMYQLIVIGFVVMVAKDLISSIKRHKSEKAKKQYDPLDKF